MSGQARFERLRNSSGEELQQELMAFAHNLELTEEDLDDLVHELDREVDCDGSCGAEDGDECSCADDGAWASAINNSGMHDQLEELGRGESPEQMIRLLTEVWRDKQSEQLKH